MTVPETKYDISKSRCIVGRGMFSLREQLDGVHAPLPEEVARCWTLCTQGVGSIVYHGGERLARSVKTVKSEP